MAPNSWTCTKTRDRNAGTPSSVTSGTGGIPADRRMLSRRTWLIATRCPLVGSAGVTDRCRRACTSTNVATAAGGDQAGELAGSGRRVPLPSRLRRASRPFQRLQRLIASYKRIVLSCRIERSDDVDTEPVSARIRNATAAAGRPPAPAATRRDRGADEWQPAPVVPSPVRATRCRQDRAPRPVRGDRDGTQVGGRASRGPLTG